MGIIENAYQLSGCFQPQEQNTLEGLDQQNFPIFIKDYHSWTSPTGLKTYMVFEDDGYLVGLSFRQSPLFNDGVKMMCEWCCQIKPAHRISLLSVNSGQYRSVGIHVCRDLKCKDSFRET